MRKPRSRLNAEFPGTTFYFLPADIVSQTVNFGLPAPFDIQVLGRDLVLNRRLPPASPNGCAGFPGRWTSVSSSRPTFRASGFSWIGTRASEVGLTERDVANSVLLSPKRQRAGAARLLAQPAARHPVPRQSPACRVAMNSLETLAGIPITASTNATGDGQILANLATVTRTNGPAVLSHYNVQPVIDVFGAWTVGTSAASCGTWNPSSTRPARSCPRQYDSSPRPGRDDAVQLQWPSPGSRAPSCSCTSCSWSTSRAGWIPS